VTRDRATLTTVAERVGVSRSTVSNAYNRPDQLSGELRRRILAAAAELGYAGPDPAARSLRRGRVGAIGLVQHSLRYTVGDAANRMLLDGVAEVCEEEGLALVLIDRRPPQPDRPDVLRNALVDGVIIHCDALDADRRRLIDDRRLPTVVLDAEAIGGGLSVGIDDEGGARAAAEHIVALGHRRVTILTLSSRVGGPHLITEARQRGYLGPLDRAGCEVEVEPAGGLEWDEFAAFVTTLLGADRPPTAILAMSDDIAAGVVRVALSMGITIPEQLSVIGFDDTPVAAGLVPPLTTVRQDHATKGRLAARMLLGQVEARRIRLPVELVVRASTAPPADRRPPSP
jgi:DNA-binding LacI/PurR family transcriptional regulator